MPDTPTAERLHDDFERLLNDPTYRHAVAGRSVLDPGLLQTMHTLRAMDDRATPPPDPAFAARLREDLMHTYPLPAYTPPNPKRPTPTPRRGIRLMPGWIRSVSGAFSTAATIALVIALVVVTVGWWDRHADPIPPTPSQVAFNAATAPPTQTIHLTMSDTTFEPSVLDIAPGTASPVTLRIENTGTRNRRFAIPALGVTLDVPLGETRDATLPLRAGVYAFFSADPRDVSAGLSGQLTVPVGTGDSTLPPLPNLIAAPNVTVWSNTTVTLKARPVPDGRPLTTFPAGFVFHPVSIDSSSYGNGEATVGGMNWTLLLAETGEIGWLETGFLTRVNPRGSDLAQATANASPVAAMDSPPIMTAGGPGRSWWLGDSNPRLDGAPRQIAADANFSVTSALVVGDSIIVSGHDTTSQYGMGSIRRIDLRTGQVLWSVDAKPWGDLAAQGNLLYTFTLDPKRATDRKPRVSAFSLSTGEEIWTSNPLVAISDAASGYGPIMMDGMLFASDAAGNTVALDPATGEQHWQYPDTPLAAPDTLDLQSSMIGANGSIYVATTDRKLVRLDAGTGMAQAASSIPSTTRSIRLQSSASGIVIATAFDKTSGLFSWQIVDPETMALGPASASNASYVALAIGNGESVYAIAFKPSGVRELISITPHPGSDFSPAPTIIASLDTLSPAQIAIAGGTIITLGTEGDIAFVHAESGATTSSTIPLATRNALGSTPPMIWGNTPVIVADDGTIWVLDGSESSVARTSTGTISINDGGFTESAFAAQTDNAGIAQFTLRNDGSQERIVVIPALGIDARIPGGTSLTVSRPIRLDGIYAIFTRTGIGIESAPELFAELHVSGLPSRSTSQEFTGVSISDINFSEYLAPGTPVRARPDAEGAEIASFSTSTDVRLLMVDGVPQNGFTTVTDAKGIEWSLVMAGSSMIGWVPSDALTLQAPTATPAP